MELEEAFKTDDFQQTLDVDSYVVIKSFEKGARN